jgi:two-component sensor histidine kinase
LYDAKTKSTLRAAEIMDKSPQRGPMHTPVPRTLPQCPEATYPGGTEHIRTVRADLRVVFDDCPRADDVILCASELAANAAQHSHSRLPGGTFTVRATINPDHYARIEVQDNGGPWNQGMIDPTRHHGLDIVRAVADEWGIDGDQTSRTIWARFDCPE